MQFDLHIDVDREALKRLAVEKLWDAHYLEPAPVGNRLGLLIRAFRGQFPQLPPEEFERQFGELVEEGLVAMDNMPRLLDTDFLADMLSGRVPMEALPILERLIYTKSTQ